MGRSWRTVGTVCIRAGGGLVVLKWGSCHVATYKVCAVKNRQLGVFHLSFFSTGTRLGRRLRSRWRSFSCFEINRVKGKVYNF